MKVSRVAPWLALCGGVVAAILRAGALATGYEPETSLPIPGSVLQIALIALTAVFVVGMFVLTRPLKAQRGILFEQVFDCDSTLYKAVSVICGLVMGGCGVYGMYLLISGNTAAEQQSFYTSQQTTILSQVTMIPLWLLAVLTMISFIMVSSMQSSSHITEGGAMWTIVPMFWACFELIITYKDNGANPFVSLYAFELFAAIALVFSFYGMAGFLYSTGNPARFVLMSALSVFFTILCVGGYALAPLFGGSPVELDTEVKLRYATFAASGVWMLCNLIISCRRLALYERTAAGGVSHA